MHWQGQPRKVLVRPERNGFVYVLDRATGKQTGVALAAGDAPAARAWRSVSFPSADGQMIQAWLATP